MIHLDTSFIVDAIREKRQNTTGPARAWLTANSGEELAVSVLVVCELMVGAELHAKPDEERHRVRQLCAGLPLVTVDERVPMVYAKIAATLIRQGTPVGAIDLLLASVALSSGASLLTRNREHFDRIPGLNVITY